jgi:hypothetical protein
MNHSEIAFGDVDWSHWAQDRGRWQSLVDIEMKILVQ